MRLMEYELKWNIDNDHYTQSNHPWAVVFKQSDITQYFHTSQYSPFSAFRDIDLLQFHRTVERLSMNQRLVHLPELVVVRQ